MPASRPPSRSSCPPATVTSRPSMVRSTVRIVPGRARCSWRVIPSSRPAHPAGGRRPAAGSRPSRPVHGRRSSRRPWRAAVRGQRRRPARTASVSGSCSSRAGSQSSAGTQPSRRLNTRLARTIRRAVACSSLAVDVPAGDRRQQVRPLRNGSVEDAAQELAQDHASPSPRPGPRSRPPRATCASPPAKPVEVAGQVGLVGARAVVVRAAGVDGQPERHRVQRARLVAGQLQALDVHGERRGAAARPLGGRAATPRRAASPSPSPRPISSSARSRAAPSPNRSHGASSSPRSAHSIAQAIGAAGGDGVEPELVAAGTGRQHLVGVGDAAHRAEGEDVLVLDPRRRPAGGAVDVLAADRAGGAAVPGRAAQRRPAPRQRARGASAKVALAKLRVGQRVDAR